MAVSWRTSPHESGQLQVYVVPFPTTRATKWAVSTRGGFGLKWSPNGRELLYVDDNNHVISVAVDTGPVFAIRQSTILFRLSYSQKGCWGRELEFSPDGKRFIRVRNGGRPLVDKMIFCPRRRLVHSDYVVGTGILVRTRRTSLLVPTLVFME